LGVEGSAWRGELEGVSGVLQPIFLSYARDDAAAARRIAEALRSAGLVVWFDENELTGGDAWDQKIRTQIAECALFVPLISAKTQARLEGYFRLEWRLAEQRSHLMAKGKRFLVPVCIDDTREKGAQVPDAFMDVQWTRLPLRQAQGESGGVATTQFVELVKRLMEGAGVAQTAAVARAFQPVGSESTGWKAHGTKTGVPAAAWIGALAVVAIGVAATFFAMRKTESPTPLASTNAGAGTRPPTTETAAPKAAEKSVAVLAFENVGGDKENEIFSDGVPDEILTQLGKVAGLRLTGRNSSFALRGRPEAEVAQKLNVSHVVSGSVQRVGSQVKITARLVNAADGTQLWQDRFTEEMKDIFTVQEKIAGLIAQNLSLKLSGASRVAKSVDPEAQRLVLEGRYHWNLRNDEGFTRAEAAFTKAITMAPDLAVAHSGLAGVWAIRGNYHQMDGMTDGREEIGRARSAAERAVQFDPNLAEAHAVLAFCLLVDGKLEESERSFQRALALNPSSTVTLSWHALVLRLMGRVDLAIAEYQRVAIMDPLWFINLLLLGSNLSDVGQWDEALSVLDRAMALRNDPYMPAVGARARALFVLGRKSDAVEMARLVRRRFDVFPRWQADAQAVFVLRQAGLEKEAAEHAAEVFARAPADSYMRGFVHVALGQFERALPYLERTSSTTGRSFVYLDQMWDPWRDDARFLQVIAKIGVTEEYNIARETVARMQRGQAGKK